MIRFSSVNRPGDRNYRPNYHRHHLIPRQAATQPSLVSIFKDLSRRGFDLDNFHTNGILLPCNEEEAIKSKRALHRGPHPHYNDVVISRMVAISKLSEGIQSRDRRSEFIAFKAHLLQRGLRRGLNGDDCWSLKLNARDPLRSGADFDQIDIRIDQLCQTRHQTPPQIEQQPRQRPLRFRIYRKNMSGPYLDEL